MASPIATLATAAGQPAGASGQGIVAAGAPPAQVMSTITVNDPQAGNGNAGATSPGALSNSLFSSTLTVTANGGNTAAGAVGGSTVTVDVGGGAAMATANGAPLGQAGAQGGDACTCTCSCPAGSFPMLAVGSMGQPPPAIGGGSPQAPAGVATTMLTMPMPGMSAVGAGQGIVAAGAPPPQAMSTVSFNDPQAAATGVASPQATLTVPGAASAVPAVSSSAPGVASSPLPAAAPSPSAAPAAAPSAAGTALADMNGSPVLTVGSGSIVVLQSAVTVPLLRRRAHAGE